MHSVDKPFPEVQSYFRNAMEYSENQPATQSSSDDGWNQMKGEEQSQEALWQVLFRTNGDGNRVFSDAELDAVVPFLFLLGGANPRLLEESPALKARVAEFIDAVGLTAGMSQQDGNAAIQAHLVSKPLNKMLVSCLNDFLEIRMYAAADTRRTQTDAFFSNLQGADTNFAQGLSRPTIQAKTKLGKKRK